MRILYAHCFYRIPGGEDRHVRDQIDLVSGNHDVELISEANADLHESPATAARMLYSHAKKREVGAVMDRFWPEIVHVHNAYPSLGPAVVLAASERNIPIVMSVHNFRLRCPNGFMFTEDEVCHRCESGVYVNAVAHRCFPTRKQAGAYATVLWAHRFIMRLEERVARFIVPSEFMRDRMLEWGIDKDRVRMIRHFVPIAGSEPSDTFGSYGAFFGRLSSEKGLDFLLAALQRSGGISPFLIVGDGPQRSALEELASKLGLANTKFVGWQSHERVGDLMAAARFVAIPSVGEEVASLSALEGLAAARPLLVSDRGALPELVAAGAGLVCRPEDSIDLSERIDELMRDDDLCRRASGKAARMAQALAPQQYLANLEGVYAEAT